MKTIIARFEDMKKDPLAILEDGVTANKVEAALATIGIALRDTAGEFRPLQDVFDELGMKWQSLTRNQQAYIATVAAGSRQQSRFLAMMNNYDRTLDLIAESQNSAGAAAEQYATYQDSVAAAQARLTASWEKFYSKIVDNSAIKIAINGLSSLVDALSKVPPAITAIGAAFGALELQSFIRGNSKNLLNNIFGQFVTKDDGSIERVGGNIIHRIFDGITTTLKDKSFKDFKEITDLSKIFPKMGEDIEKGLGKVPGSLSKVGTSFASVGKLIAGFIAANWQVIAIASAVAGAIYLINKALNANKKKYEDSINAIKKYNQEASDLKDKTSNAESLFDTYDDLISKMNRTAEEQKELNSTIEAISDIYPNAITYVDEYGNKHLENVDVLKQEIELEKQLAKEKQRAALQEREELLDGNRNNWKKEDFSTIGFSNNQIDAYFKLQEELDYYRKTVKQFYSGPKGSSKLEQDINSLQFSIKNEEIDTIEAANLAIEEINKTIDKYHLNIEKLAKDSSWELISKRAEQIIYQHDNTDKIINELEKQQEEIIQHLQRDNKIKLSFLDLIYSDKAGTAVAQRSIAAQLETFISGLSNDAYKVLEEKFGDDGLTGFIQKFINGVTTENSVDIKNLLEEAFDLSTSDERLQQIYEEGQKYGISFKNGFEEAITEQRKINRQNLEEAVRNQYNLTNTFPLSNIDSNILNATLELGKRGEKNFKTAYKMAPIYEEAKKLYEDAIRTGVIDGLGNAFANIDISKLDKYSQERIKEYFKQLEEDAIFEATHEAFANLQKRAVDFIKDTKGKLSTVESEGRIKAEDYNIAESDFDGVYYDITSGEKMVSISRTLADIDKENNKILEDTKTLYRNNIKLIEDIKNKGEEATDQEKKQKKELEIQNELLIQQYSYYKKISNVTLEAGWNTSIKLAKNYQSQLQTINSLEKAMKEQGGVLFLDDMEDAMSILPEFQNRFTEISDNTYTISAENIEAMKKEIKSEYDLWLAQEKAKATVEYENAVANYELISKMAEQEGIIDDTNTQQFIENNKEELKSTKGQLEQSLNASYDEIKQELNAHSEKDNQMVAMFNQALNEMALNYENFIEDLGDGKVNIKFDEVIDHIKATPISATTSIEVEWSELEGDDSEAKEKRKKLLEAALEESAEAVRTSWKKLSSLKEINVPQLEKLSHELEEAGKGSKETEKALEALTKAVEDLNDALKDLDDLLKDVKRNLDDITVDYNPFTDLFEAWEAEWDYYYNIKNLINQLETQANYIDKVISSDYSSAQDKLRAYDAKVGNITSKLAANDAYILSLRAGIAQQAKEFEKEFNEYYNVDNRMGGWQIFQRDTTLNQWEETINDVKKVSYELSKLINQQENELNLMEATQEALEQQRSAYESMLSTVDSLVDSLEDNEDITVDLTGLKGMKVKLEAAIDDGSIEEVKQQIRDLNDYIQELNWQLDLNDNVVEKGLEDAYDDMQDSMSHIQDLIDTLNDKLAEQQELVQELSEVYNYYVDTAIDMQQELYNAIVEQYQDEINQKKQQYDYLKQLDKDYLQSVKDNINKERQAREDANKEKSYQQSLQRAQLLQQDTSGAYRKELANLNKEIESQRQDLYDDLVDKQVNALEKEIEKRHELYDMEVNALQERLDYMQENAILLWEMVNDIVAEGADSMMATLENTTNYINQNELTRERQRRQWELNTQATYKGVIEGEIESLNQRIAKGKEYIDSLTEIKDAIDLNTQTYIMSKDILEDEAGKMQIVMDGYMQAWTTLTSDLTGYHENWKTTVNALMTAMEKDIQALSEMGDEGGSIYILKEKLTNIADEMYNSFIEERQAMRDSLNRQLNSIEAEITGIVKNVGDTIQRTADSIQIATPQQQNTGTPSGGSEGSSYIPTQPDTGSLAKEPEKKKEFEYKIQIYGYKTHNDWAKQENEVLAKTVIGSTPEEAKKMAEKAIQYLKENSIYKYFEMLKQFSTGGFADFTGPAWLDGTKSKPEAVLNAKQTRLFTNMVSSLERTAANNSNINSALGSSYNIGDINTNINVDRLDNETDIDKVAKQVENRIMKSIHNRVVLSVV